MELRVLQYFLAVVREENISRAAEALHMTQPTLSRQIKELEEELGASLFTRGRRLTLTDAGVMLRKRAEEVVQLIDRIGNDFAAGEDLSGTILIGAGGLSAAHKLPAVIRDFQALYPKVRFDLYSNDAAHVKDRLDRGLLDFAFLLEPIDVARYDYLRLNTPERWGLLVPADSPLAEKASVTAKELRSLPLITAARLSVQKELGLWMKCDLDELHIVATYNLITNAAAMVSEGVAYALTIEGAVHFFDPARLRFLPLEPELSMTSVVAWKKLNPIFGLQGRFLEHLRNYPI